MGGGTGMGNTEDLDLTRCSNCEEVFSHKNGDHTCPNCGKEFKCDRERCQPES